MALTKPIKGIIGACLTPFDDSDRVNYKALEKQIDFIVADCDAITIAAVEAAEYTMSVIFANKSPSGFRTLFACLRNAGYK